MRMPKKMGVAGLSSDGRSATGPEQHVALGADLEVVAAGYGAAGTGAEEAECAAAKFIWETRMSNIAEGAAMRCTELVHK